MLTTSIKKLRTVSNVKHRKRNILVFYVMYQRKVIGPPILCAEKLFNDVV